ncbi:MAG TPA: galactitol-1-phosphate 5-dehydrogenase [Bryobacteraceae bacterium]|jgi:L-iditol 2-dehydrogenase|nr:galactitol-1-phosphate 5-dehydrogenase [Bryobacteraceae bacterium]
MKALLLTDYMHLELADVAVPAIGPRDVLIRVRSCGICGSDVHGIDGSTGRRIPPLVMGHEAAGVIEQVGADAGNWKPCDRITFDSTISCGECAFCRSGDINLCDNRQVLGVSCGDYRRHGAFAEYVSVPARILYRLPDSLSFDQAAMIEAVSVAVHAVSLTPLSPGDTAVVIGCGMIGQLTIQAAKAAGFAKVYGVDVDDARLTFARRAGADEVFHSQTSDVPAEIRARTSGRGADAVLEAVGTTAPIQTAIACVRKGGAVTLIGNFSGHIELPLQQVVTRQIRLQGSCASAGEYPKCIELMASGQIRVDDLISAYTPLEDAAGWFDRLYRREPNLMKVIVRP